jgi:hypothetical protein
MAHSNQSLLTKKWLIARVSLGITQLCAVAYVAFVTWLMSVWMVDDHWAAHAHTFDWFAEGLTRLAVGVLTGIMVGALLWIVNRFLARWNLAWNLVRPGRLGLVGALLVIVASLVGTIQFIVTRPYM